MGECAVGQPMTQTGGDVISQVIEEELEEGKKDLNTTAFS